MFIFIKNLPKHLKGAFKNLARHLTMTLSCTTEVMTTLFLLSVAMLLAANMNAFTKSIEGHLKIHAALDTIVQGEQIKQIHQQIEKNEKVKSVTFSSKEDELNLLIDESGSIFERYRDHNPMPNVFIIEVKQAADIPALTKELNQMDGIEKAQYGGDSIRELLTLFKYLRIAIIGFVMALSVLSVFLIMTTIKLTISMRKQEIAIMRNVGADNWYIKMPFIFEGMYIGIFSAILPIAATIVIYTLLFDHLHGHFFTTMFALIEPSQIVYQVSAVLLISGMSVGIVSSLLATTRYMRWKR